MDEHGSTNTQHEFKKIDMEMISHPNTCVPDIELNENVPNQSFILTIHSDDLQTESIIKADEDLEQTSKGIQGIPPDENKVPAPYYRNDSYSGYYNGYYNNGYYNGYYERSDPDLFNLYEARQIFIFKVFLLMAMSFGFSLIMATSVKYNTEIFDFMRTTEAMIILGVLLGLFVIVLCTLCCCIILLMAFPFLAFTAFIILVILQTYSGMLVAASIAHPEVVILTFALALIIAVLIALCAVFLDFEIADLNNVLCYFFMFFLVDFIGCLTGILVFQLKWYWCMAIFIFILIFIVFILYDIQLLVQGIHADLSPDMVWMGAIFLYTDVFLILQMLAECLLFLCDE